MNCNQARKLFAAFWDDETTQVEREWLEAHFASCTPCRHDYEQYARTLEALGSLPRLEPAPDMVERVLQRVRRAETVPDRVPAGRPIWIPVASGVAAAVLIALTLAGPWMGMVRSPRVASRGGAGTAATQQVLLRTPVKTGSESVAGSRLLATGRERTDSFSDSLFDHSEDVEFILDPVTLHRGRAAVNRTSSGTPEERSVITF